MAITAVPTRLPEVFVIIPKVFGDDRGSFFESYNAGDFERATGVSRVFVQDNHSTSVKGVLRGLHYQLKRPQGKLLRVIRGAIYDVAVDIRRGSPNFGRWAGVELSAENRKQLWVPEGFAHGFLVTSESAEVLYKTTDFWFPEHERSIIWNDEELGIEWPIDGQPILSGKDAGGVSLEEAELE